eukprot:6212588-Pleurochrysis_carterae.AAC.4
MNLRVFVVLLSGAPMNPGAVEELALLQARMLPTELTLDVTFVVRPITRSRAAATVAAVWRSMILRVWPWTTMPPS